MDSERWVGEKNRSKNPSLVSQTAMITAEGMGLRRKAEV